MATEEPPCAVSKPSPLVSATTGNGNRNASITVSKFRYASHKNDKNVENMQKSTVPKKTRLNTW